MYSEVVNRKETDNAMGENKQENRENRRGNQGCTITRNSQHWAQDTNKTHTKTTTKTINSCAKSVWYARRQHSYNICKDFLSHNSWMKNLNFTNSCTINMNWNIYTYDTFFEKSVKTINSNNSTKFEVNWPRGSQFTARHTKNCLQFDE